MIILKGCAIVPTVNGPKEDLDNMADLETRLYWEQMLDRGDAVLTHLIDVGSSRETVDSHFSHRLISETGGVFHVLVDHGRSRQWPGFRLPDTVQWIEDTAAELQRVKETMSRLYLACDLMQRENDAWRKWRERQENPLLTWPEEVDE